jgi:hypothetical protein
LLIDLKYRLFLKLLKNQNLQMYLKKPKPHLNQLYLKMQMIH